MHGRVRVSGKVPALPPIPTVPSVAKVCGPERPDDRLQVSADGGLQNAIVFIADAPAEPTPPGTQVSLDQRACSYLPPVLAARSGSTLVVLNSDPLMHNVRAGGHATALFNVAMPVQGMKLTRVLPADPRVIDFHCDVHPWMHSVVRTFDNGHFATTDAGGRFSLPHLAPGKHTLTVFHQLWPEKSVTVDVPAGGSATQDVELDASDLHVESVIGQ